MGRKKPSGKKPCRLSTVAILDDVKRVNKILAFDYESKFIDLLLGHEKVLKRLGILETENENLRASVQDRQQQISFLKASLDKTYQDLEEEARQRSHLERRLQNSEQQLDFIRQILNERDPDDALERARKALVPRPGGAGELGRSRTSSGRPMRPSTNFSVSAGSLLDPEDVSLDHSLGDREHSRLRKRRSHSEPPDQGSGRAFKPMARGDTNDISPFRHRESISAGGVITSQTKVTVTDNFVTHVDTEVMRLDASHKKEIVSSEESEAGRSAPMLRHSNSTSAVPGSRKRASDDSQDSYFGLPVKQLITDNPINEQGNTNRPATPDAFNHTPVGTPRTGGGKLAKSGSASRLTRSHMFWSKTVLKLETCVACSKRIKFGKNALKCADCKTIVHLECREKAPQPCIPASHNTGTPVSKTGLVHLSELCPVNETPQIPGVVIHCVNEIETRGLSQEGIYRICGTEKQVKDLLDKFLRGRPPYPSLSAVQDIHVICGCLKLFLRRLSEPLITYHMWSAFSDLAEAVQASSLSSDEVRSRARLLFFQLPRPNRDTLAYLILHLQRVASSAKCSMGTDNLAKVLGPTLIGYSCPEPEPLQAIQENRSQQSILRFLLSLPSDQYSSMIQAIDHDTPPIMGRVFDTPLIRDKSAVSSLTSVSATPVSRTGKVRKPVFDPLFEPL